MTDLIREISQTLGHNKVRTALTGIAVTWGIFMLIVLLGMGRGLVNGFDQMLMSPNATAIRVYPGLTSVPWKGNREGREIQLLQSDMTGIAETDPRHVERVTSKISGGGKIKSLADEVSSSYNGVYPSEVPTGHRGTMTEGRFINDLDMAQSSRVVVLPKNYASTLFPPDGSKAVGERVEINRLSFLVIGLYESRWARDCYIPYTTAQRMAKDKNETGPLTVYLTGVSDAAGGKEVETEIRSTLAHRHNFDPADENALYTANGFENTETLNQAMGIIQMSVWILGLLTLLTGVVGVSNIMFVTVRERTHEIGIRRAIGAKPRKILTQIIAEAVAITLIFGYIGIVLGTAATQVVAHFVDTGEGPFSNPTVSLAIAAEVTAVLVATGVLAGLFPALKALKVRPVEALHDE